MGQWLIVDAWSPDVLWPVMLQLVVAGIQVAVGCSFAFGARRAGWILLACQLAGSLVLVVASRELVSDAGVLPLIGVIIETLGTPALVIVALLLGRTAGASPRQEVGVVLLVFGISTLLNAMLQTFEFVVMLVDERFSPGAASNLVWIGSYIAVAVLEIRAGLALRRGASNALRAFNVFMIVSLSLDVLWLLIGMGVGVVEDGRLLKFLAVTRGTSAVTSAAWLFVLWAFVRKHTAPPVATAVPMFPAWYTLLFLPMLAARPLALANDRLVELVGETSRTVIIVAFAAFAISAALASVSALRERMSASAFAAAASLVGVATTCVVVVAFDLGPGPKLIQAAPLLNLIVATAMIARLHRTATPPVPRAVVVR
jgi:hypothetical protein